LEKCNKYPFIKKKAQYSLNSKIKTTFFVEKCDKERPISMIGLAHKPARFFSTVLIVFAIFRNCGSKNPFLDLWGEGSLRIISTKEYL
jgi:hypothetical protein